MDSGAPAAVLPWLWVGLGLLALAAGAGAAWWIRRRKRRRVAHYLFTPLPCTFHPASFDAPKSLFDVAWDLGISDSTFAMLQQLKLLPRGGRLNYDDLNRTLDYFVQQLGGYRNFVYRCRQWLEQEHPAAEWDEAKLTGDDRAIAEYVGTEERYLERYVGNPTGLLQNRMVAYLYNNAKTKHARKFGLALAFDYQSFQLLNRCAAREIAETTSLLKYTGTSAHDKGMRGAQIKAVASGTGVAALEMAKASTAGVAEGAAAVTEVATGLGAEAAAGIAAEGGAMAARELTGVLTLGHIASQFVPIVQGVVLAYGAVQIGRIVWKKGQKSNTWLRERKLRGLQGKLGERLDALYGRYERLRDTHTPNTAPFAPAHELLALCEFEEQRLAAFREEIGGRTGHGDLGLLRAHLCDHAVDVSRGLAKGLATHLKKLIAETDARLAQGDKAAAALHLFLNKDLVFPPLVQDELHTPEIATLAADVSAEVQRLNSAG